MSVTIFHDSGHSRPSLRVRSNSAPIQFIDTQPKLPRIIPNPSSTVPFRRDPDFVDRDILAEVEKKCSKPASRAALVGLGGVGKSQLAIEYSHRIRDQFPQTWIFWVHASNATRFEEGYRMIADRTKLPGRDEPTVDILQLVSNWLCDARTGQWIIILDNADDPAVFSDPGIRGLRSDIGVPKSLSAFLPQTPNGSILVTSRSKDAAFRLTGSYHNIIKVEPMDESDALQLYGKKIRDGFDKDDVIELLRALDYMPLAISQAAAYISQRAPRITAATYLNDFRKSDWNRANLLNKDVGDLRRDSKASNSIITTWQISFEFIRYKRPSAARLLSLMSLCDRQGIPEILLFRYDKKGDTDIDLTDKGTKDLEDDSSDIDFEDDVSTLTSHSLIATNVEGDQYEMHRLLQFATRRWLELNSELDKWKKIYIKVILKAFPTGNYEHWTTCQVLFPHAEAVLAYRPAERKYLIYWSEVLDKAGRYAATQGNYLTAEELNRRALEAKGEALGEEHLDTLTSVNNLALVLQYQGKYEVAEQMNRRALEGREKGLGKEHPDTLTSVSNLALVLHDLGKYGTAEEMGRQALEGREKTLRKEHPDTLVSVSNLALVLQYQGKYEEAEQMNRRALEGNGKKLGKEHPDTLTSVSNLALVLHDQGKYEAAEKMGRQALEGREKTLRKGHPDTLVSISNLALVLHYQGKYEEAEEMNRRALEGSEKELGKEHPDTLTSVSNLALVLHDQGKYEMAEEMNRRALDGYEKALGKDHPDTLVSVSNLALVLQAQSKYEPAEEMNRRALDGFEKALGKDHPNTLTSLNNLAELLRDQGKYEAVEEMNRRALDGFEKTLGKVHPKTLTSLSNLAELLLDQGKSEAAEEMSRRALAGREKALRVLMEQREKALRMLMEQKRHSLYDWSSAVSKAKGRHQSKFSTPHSVAFEIPTPTVATQPIPTRKSTKKTPRSLYNRLFRIDLAADIPGMSLTSRLFPRRADADVVSTHTSNSATGQGQSFVNTMNIYSPSQRRLISMWSYPSRQLIKFLMAFWPEDPVPTGKKRIRWTCHCGYRSFDDFVELRPGAADEYETFLREHSRARQHSHSATNRTGLFRSLRNFGTTFSFLGKQTANQTCLPQFQTTGNAPNNQTRTHTPSADKLFLLLCLPHQQFATKLVQLDLREMVSDQEFFCLLKRNYRSMRGVARSLLSLKTLKKVKFVQFEMYKSELVDIRKVDDIPPEDRKDEYRYRPVPAEIIPPVGENIMMHLCTHPDDADETRAICLDRIPKKLKERLLVCPNNGTAVGWGLQFVEGWHYALTWLLVFVALLVSSLLFLVCWAVLKHDLQGASGVAAYILAFVTLSVGTVQAAFELY